MASAIGDALLTEAKRAAKEDGNTLGAPVVVGPRVREARVAALCLHHGVREPWTADRDFGRFPSLSTRNPLVSTA